MSTKDSVVDLALIQNARIYVSGDTDYNWMLFNKKSGYINSIGRDDPPTEKVQADNIIDCAGRRVLPGLHESHIHLSTYGLALMNLDVSGSTSIEQLQQKLSVFSKANPDRKCIVGNGWMQDELGRYPTKGDLDLVCPDRPVIIFRVCIHIAVVNSMALKLAGINKGTKDPEGGQIDHNKDGQPTGIIREVVDELFFNALRPTEHEKFLAIEGGIRECLKNGVTTAHALDREGTWKILCDLVEKNKLPMRIIYVPYWENRIHQVFPGPGEKRGPMLWCDRIKIFSDGGLGACTAAISRSYRNGEENKGILLHPQTELDRYVAEATAEGYRLEIHAIGDTAIDAVLTSLEQGNVAPERRPIMVHCQILRKDLIERMKNTGTIASIQPQSVPTESRWVPNLLPDELQQYTYAWKTLLSSGVACCGGSDAPVESPQPLLGIYDAIFRPDGPRTDEDTGCFRPEERLSVQQAIDLYTRGGAYATLREHDLGQLLPGYQADFIVLDTQRDPVVHPEEFLTATVSQVWVTGVRRF